MSKQRRGVLTKLLGPSPEPVAFRIVIEGVKYGDAKHVKQQALAEIEDAASQVTGAGVIYVTTLRGRNKGKLNLRTSGVRGKSVAPGIKSHDDEDEPSLSNGVVRRGRGTGNTYSPVKRKVSALMANQARYGWTDAELIASFEKHRVVSVAKQMGVYPGGGYYKPRGSSAGDEPKPTRQRARRVPNGLSVVEVRPNGVRILSDGSHLGAGPNGKLHSPASVAQMRENAAAARAARKRKRNLVDLSFPEPPAVADVERQEESHQEAVTAAYEAVAEAHSTTLDQLAQERPQGENGVLPVEHSYPKPLQEPAKPIQGKKPGVIRRVLGWRVSQGDALPYQDLPEQSSEQWWDNIVRAYLLDDTDPVELCRVNHIRREALDAELEKRGIRPYAIRSRPQAAPARRH